MYEYVKGIKKDKLGKQYEWASAIYIYINDCVVYKIAIQFDYGTLKKAKKYGVLGEWKLIHNVNDRLIVDEDKMKKGKKILKYLVHDGGIEFWNGEAEY